MVRVRSDDSDLSANEALLPTTHLQVVQRREVEPSQRSDVVRRLATVDEELVAGIRVHPEVLRLVSQGYRAPVCVRPPAAQASAQGRAGVRKTAAWRCISQPSTPFEQIQIFGSGTSAHPVPTLAAHTSISYDPDHYASHQLEHGPPPLTCSVRPAGQQADAFHAGGHTGHRVPFVDHIEQPHVDGLSQHRPELGVRDARGRKAEDRSHI